jgi:hypothetical protein
VAVERLHREFFRPIRRFLQPRRNRRAACPSSTGQPPSRGLAALPVTDFQKEFVIDSELLTGRIRSLVRWAGLL